MVCIPERRRVRILGQYGLARIGWTRVVLFTAAFAVSMQLFAQDGTNRQLKAAAQCLASGHLGCADKELDSVLRTSPDEYRALDLLGVVRVLQKREKDAEDLFLHALRTNPAFASAHAHLGLLYLQMERPDEAVPELRTAVKLDPGRTDAADALIHIWREEAQSAVAAGDSEQALASLIEARKLAPNNPDVQFEFGMAALRMSLFQDATKAFRKTLELRKDPLAVYGLGRALMGLARFEDARQQFVRYVAARPDDPAGHCALGMTLAALERSAEARVQFEKSIALSPRQIESYYRLGLMELESKDFDPATKNLRLVLDRDPKHSGALTALGRVEFEQKHYSEAVGLLQRAIASGNSLGEAHYYLGRTYARMGRKAEADQEFQIAVQLEQQAAEKARTIRILEPAGAQDHGPKK
jgi:tetratricopeptide (TPR) repeat protein